MKSSHDESTGWAFELLPHQTALIETFFNPSTKRVIILDWPAGTGKTVSLAALTSRLLQERPSARVLFVVPNVLREQVIQMLRRTSVPCLLVDRYRFRDLLDSASGELIWPVGIVIVLDMDFAKQPDVRDKLSQTNWDLMVVEESHLVKKSDAEFLQQLGKAASRVILSSRTGSHRAPNYATFSDDSTVMKLALEKIVGYDGKRLYVQPTIVLHEVNYDLNDAELQLRRTVHKMCNVLRRVGGEKDLRLRTVLRSLESSQAALETTVQQLASRTSVDAREDQLDLFDDAINDEEAAVGIVDRSTAEEIGGFAGRVLKEIESINSDSKLSAFGELLVRLKEPTRRICVLTEFRASLYYLASQIESLGLRCNLLHGGMRFEERMKSLQHFSDEGGILVASTAVMGAGIAMPDAADLVLYDIPANKAWLIQILGRFNRLRKSTQLNVYVLVHSGPHEGPGPESLRMIRDTLGDG